MGSTPPEKRESGRVAEKIAAMDLVVFDFDGTLADSEDLLTGLVVRALTDSGLTPVAPAAIGRLIGLPLLEVLSLASGVPAERLDAVAQLFRRHADSDDVVGQFRLFPGVRPALEAMAARGQKLAIATSKSRAVTERILAAVHLDGLVPLVVGGDSVRRGKPDPEAVHLVLERTGCAAAKAAVVGDTPYDILMGKAAGVCTVAAAYGMHDRESLAAAAPDHIIDGIAELVGGSDEP